MSILHFWKTEHKKTENKGRKKKNALTDNYVFISSGNINGKWASAKSFNTDCSSVQEIISFLNSLKFGEMILYNQV